MKTNNEADSEWDDKFKITELLSKRYKVNPKYDFINVISSNTRKEECMYRFLSPVH